jgi:hypothetical protein
MLTVLMRDSHLPEPDEFCLSLAWISPVEDFCRQVGDSFKLTTNDILFMVEMLVETLGEGQLTDFETRLETWWMDDRPTEST